MCKPALKIQRGSSKYSRKTQVRAEELMLICNESEERVKAEMAHKQFDFTTAGLFEGFVWDLNERCHF